MDLFDNKFNGNLPTEYFKNLVAIKDPNTDQLEYIGECYYQDSMILVVKGFLTEFVKIQMIFTIDFSKNKFQGEIPRLIGKLKSLKALNLLRNRLVGRIPHGKQFDTFDNNSYSENLGLCGFPLSKMCGNNNEPQQSLSLNIQEEGGWKEIHGFEWKIILMGYGCGVVIGISMG
nr:receptor-like protein 9DC3 [Ziziphus jujuba var. spinosa]